MPDDTNNNVYSTFNDLISQQKVFLLNFYMKAAVCILIRSNFMHSSITMTSLFWNMKCAWERGVDYSRKFCHKLWENPNGKSLKNQTFVLRSIQNRKILSHDLAESFTPRMRVCDVMIKLWLRGSIMCRKIYVDCNLRLIIYLLEIFLALS